MAANTEPHLNLDGEKQNHEFIYDDYKIKKNKIK